MEQETLVQKIEQFSDDLALLSRAVHGTETETVLLGGVPTPSYRKLVADVDARESAAAQAAIAAGVTTVQTIADTATQHVADATALAVTAATEQANRAKGYADAAQAVLPEAIAERVTAVETKNSQQDTRLDGVDSSVTALATTLIGAIFPLTCADSYVPNGTVPANGGEYTQAQFPSFYDTYLAPGKLLTCTYAQQAAQVALTGNCAKFAVDPDNKKFKVPLIKDGDSITQANSSAEIGKSVKAGLPNITATVGKIWNAEIATGACYRGSNEQSLSAGAGSVNYCPVYIDASRSSSVYGNSTTVTDEQVRLRHFVVVASAQNSASVFDWSAYMAALAGKANVDFNNVDLTRANIVLQRVPYETGSYASTTSVIPCDDTVPQITEGAQFMSLSITPKRANSKIEIDVTLHVTCYNATSHLVAAVFKDSDVNAIASAIVTNGGVGFYTPMRIKKIVQFSDTNPHTISVRVGVPNNSYPISINGLSSRVFGGSLVSSLVLTEYAA